MKKMFFLILIYFFSLHLLDAQELGLKVGTRFNIVSVLGLGEYEKKVYPGFIGGVFSRFALGKKGFYLQSELLLSVYTFKSKGEGTRYYPVINDIIWTEGAGRATITELYLPVLFGKKISLGKQNLRLYSGPTLGTFLNSKGQGITRGVNRETGEPLLNPITGEEVIFIDSQDFGIVDFDFGTYLQTGLGIDFFSFSLDLSHQTSLTFLGQSKNQNLLLTFGYQLFDKKRVKDKK